MVHLKEFLFQIIFWAGLALPLMPEAQAAPMRYELAPESSRVEFTGKSTLHEIHGNAQAEGSILYDAATGTVPSPAEIRISVRSMKTGSGMRDEAMYKMFGAAQYPELIWSAGELVCEPLAAQQGAASVCLADGFMRIGAVQKAVPLSIRLDALDGSIRASGKTVLNLRDFNLKPPSVMGVIRVDRTVDVEFDTVWKPSQP